MLDEIANGLDNAQQELFWEEARIIKRHARVALLAVANIAT